MRTSEHKACMGR